MTQLAEGVLPDSGRAAEVFGATRELVLDTQVWLGWGIMMLAWCCTSSKLC
jgi:hypothetical protein